MLDITHASPDDRSQVVQFMCEAFPRAKWSRDAWERLLSNRWGAPEDSFALTVCDAGRLVGVLGLVSARRPTATGMAKTINMTSWYVLKDYRGQGIGSRMLEFLTADKDATVTNFTSAKGAVPVVERAGFTVLDDRRRVWRASGRATLEVQRRPLEIADRLDPRDVQILRDHEGLNLVSVAVETPDGPCVLVLSVKQKHDDYVTHEALYVGDGAVFARNARAIADSLLPPDGAILSVDSRYLPTDVEADRIEMFEVARYAAGGMLPPGQIDTLYSEIVLLDLKLY